MGIEIFLEISCLGGEGENLLAKIRRGGEIETEGVAIIGIFGEFATGIVMRRAIGLDKDGVVFGLRLGKIEGEGDACRVGRLRARENGSKDDEQWRQKWPMHMTQFSVLGSQFLKEKPQTRHGFIIGDGCWIRQGQVSGPRSQCKLQAISSVGSDLDGGGLALFRCRCVQVTDGYCQGVGGIGGFGDFIEVQEARHHLLHLMLFRFAVTYYG